MSGELESIPFLKGGLISESFSLWLKSQKEVLNDSPEHRWKVLWSLIRHLLLEI